MHAVPLGTLEQMNVLESLAPRLERVQRRLQHCDIAFDVLDAALPKRGTRGEVRVGYRFDGRQRAPAGCGIGQVGDDMRERGCAGRRRVRHAVNAPSGTAAERGGDRTSGGAGRPDDKCDTVSHG